MTKFTRFWNDEPVTVTILWVVVAVQASLICLVFWLVQPAAVPEKEVTAVTN